MKERTVVVFKPDAVERGLVGEILSRFERMGIRIVGSRTAVVGEDLVALHYPDDEEYLRSVGVKALSDYESRGEDPKKAFGSDDPVEIGRKVRNWNMHYLSQGPVMAFVLEGDGAVKTVRKIVGVTNPVVADIGTVRGDYSLDSIETANKERRSVRNLIHASGSVKEAKQEIKLWFKEEELI
jgi:nucleoside-diphosphate kinase